MLNPKVSIIIPVYNGGDYLSTAIECALSQTYQNKEILVVNDGSIDDGETERIAQSFGKKIRYIKKVNGGVSSALNLGIQQMTGDFFSWLSHDDMYSCNKIADAVRLLDTYELLDERCIAFTGGYFIDLNGEKINSFRKYFEEKRVYSGEEVIDVMTRKGTLNGCCMLIPKKAFEEVALFDETLRYSQDSLMWYQVFLAGYSLISDNNSNVMYRLHRNQTSQLRKDLYEKDALTIVRVLAKPLLEVDISGKLLYQYAKRLTKYQCKESVDFLCNFGKCEKCFSTSRLFRIAILKRIGYFRDKIVQAGKHALLLFHK